MWQGCSFKIKTTKKLKFVPKTGKLSQGSLDLHSKNWLSAED